MMRLVSEIARPHGVKTMVSLNPIMVDGTGMCGACRVSVGGHTKFACVDGPEFDAQEIDWDLLVARRCTYPVPVEMSATMNRCQSCGQW
jgi:ferredoxin--NADP+ reductase